MKSLVKFDDYYLEKNMVFLFLCSIIVIYIMDEIKFVAFNRKGDFYELTGIFR